MGPIKMTKNHRLTIDNVLLIYRANDRLEGRGQIHLKMASKAGRNKAAHITLVLCPGGMRLLVCTGDIRLES